MATLWARRLAIVVALAGAAWFARSQWDRLSGVQSVPMLFDSGAYLEIAAKPVDLAYLGFTKPPTVPLLYRAVGGDLARQARVQGELAFASWAVLTTAMVLALRRPAVRFAAVIVGIAFLLAAPRVGWAGVLLSESPADSLMALIVAAAIGLATAKRRPVQLALGAALIALSIAWIFARDTNAIAALVAIAVAAAVWPVRRWWSARRGGVAIAVATLAASLIAIGSTRLMPEPPLGFQRSWYPPLTPRAAYPVVNNVLTRMMHDDAAWLAERGAPVALLAPFAGERSTPNKFVQRTPELEPAQAWVAEHGAATYLRWLARHPLDRLFELIKKRKYVLGGRFRSPMPTGWVLRDPAHPVIELLRGVTTEYSILWILIAASPLLLLRPRASPLTAIALVIVASGAVAAAASYYGDAIELARHCYGAGQQITLGVFLAALAWLDRARWALPWRTASTDGAASAT